MIHLQPQGVYLILRPDCILYSSFFIFLSILKADPEADHISIALDDSKALLDITESDHFVGGVPPDFPTPHFLQDHDLNFEGFFGCIHSVRPNQLSELDLDNPLRAQRKEAGCRYQEERLSTSERIIGFQVEFRVLLSKINLFFKGN